MKLKEMVALVRQRMKDKDPRKPLWSNADIIQGFNEAQWQACRRARLIKDSTTDAVCTIPLQVNTSLYKLHPSIILVRRVKLDSLARPLPMKRVRDMDRELPGWEAHTGNVSAWVPDYSTGNLRTYRIPDSTAIPGTITLTVERGPLTVLAKDGDEPEIHPRYHYKLHHHVLELLYSDQDAETYDAQASKNHADAFTAEFGPPVSATEETWIEENLDFADEYGEL